MTFPIRELRNNHWYDATKEHVKTADVRLDIPGAEDKLAYICTYTYGRWRPIFYGHRAQDHRYRFEAMAVDVLYRGAYMEGDSVVLSTGVYLLNREGVLEQQNLVASDASVRQLRMEKVNYGGEAWIRQGKPYAMLGLNTIGGWDTLATQVAQRDSILAVGDLPGYRIFLLKDLHASKDFERPFTMVWDSLVWY